VVHRREVTENCTGKIAEPGAQQRNVHHIVTVDRVGCRDKGNPLGVLSMAVMLLLKTVRFPYPLVSGESILGG
jgi:hypothetical protein